MVFHWEMSKVFQVENGTLFYIQRTFRISEIFNVATFSTIVSYLLMSVGGNKTHILSFCIGCLCVYSNSSFKDSENDSWEKWSFPMSTCFLQLAILVCNDGFFCQLWIFQKSGPHTSHSHKMLPNSRELFFLVYCKDLYCKYWCLLSTDSFTRGPKCCC